MASQGRKSAAELSVVRVAPLARPEAPADMAEGARAAWGRIVDSLPADWFSEGDLPALRAYCAAVDLHERVSVQCETADFTVSGAQGGEVVNPIFRVQDMAARQIASLGVKLRLVQSARYDPRKAAGRAKEGGSKLWSA